MFKKNQNTQPKFTDEERANMKSRTIQDAEFLKEGGEYTKLGRLALSEESVAKAYEAEARREFMKTAEYTRMNSHIDQLSSTATGIGVAYLGYAGSPDIAGRQRKLDAGISYLAENGVRLDLSHATADTAEATVGSLRSKANTLMAAELPLAERTDIRFGSQVSVLRNPTYEHPKGYVEAGWTIEDIDANARFVLSRPDGDRELEKTVPIDQVLALNPAPQPDAQPVTVIYGAQ